MLSFIFFAVGAFIIAFSNEIGQKLITYFQKQGEFTEIEEAIVWSMTKIWCYAGGTALIVVGFAIDRI